MGNIISNLIESLIEYVAGGTIIIIALSPLYTAAELQNYSPIYNNIHLALQLFIFFLLALILGVISDGLMHTVIGLIQRDKQHLYKETYLKIIVSEYTDLKNRTRNFEVTKRILRIVTFAFFTGYLVSTYIVPNPLFGASFLILDLFALVALINIKDAYNNHLRDCKKIFSSEQE